MTILNCYIPGTVKCIHHNMNGKWGKKDDHKSHASQCCITVKRNGSVLETDLRND